MEDAEAERDAEIVDGPVGGEVGSERSGRLLAPDEGVHDDVDGPVAADEGIDGAAASAEEAAVHPSRSNPRGAAGRSRAGSAVRPTDAAGGSARS